MEKTDIEELKRLRRILMEKVEKIKGKNFCGKGKSYRYEHIYLVIRLIKELNKRNSLNLNEVLLEILALAHDIKKNKKKHAKKAWKYLQIIIRKENIRLSKSVKDILGEGIKKHNDINKEKNSSYTKILQDADKLAKCYDLEDYLKPLSKSENIKKSVDKIQKSLNFEYIVSKKKIIHIRRKVIDV